MLPPRSMPLKFSAMRLGFASDFFDVFGCFGVVFLFLFVPSDD